jgi:hypothetical protein
MQYPQIHAYALAYTSTGLSLLTNQRILAPLGCYILAWILAVLYLLLVAGILLLSTPSHPMPSFSHTTLIINQ